MLYERLITGNISGRRYRIVYKSLVRRMRLSSETDRPLSFA